METNEQKKCNLKTIVSIVLLSIYIPSFIIAMVLQKCNNNSVGYFIALCCELIIGSCSLYFLIKYSIDKSNCCYKRLVASFFTNILFLIVPIMFVFNDTESLMGSLVLIFTLIIFIVTFILLNIFVKINKGDDISLLKATNFFIVFLFTAIKLLKGDSFLIGYYVLLPLILAQALYELFDSKSRQ
jgi:hypothetical protein